MKAFSVVVFVLNMILTTAATNGAEDGAEDGAKEECMDENVNHGNEIQKTETEADNDLMNYIATEKVLLAKAKAKAAE